MEPLVEDLCLGLTAKACLGTCHCGWCGEWGECARWDNGTLCPGFEPAACRETLRWAAAGAFAVLMLATFALSLSLACRVWCCRPGDPAMSPLRRDPMMSLTLHESDDES